MEEANTSVDLTLRRDDGRMDWSYRKTSLLLRLYKGHLVWFRNPTTKKKYIWQKIAVKMQRYGYKQISWALCEKKFRNLRGAYLRLMENVDKNSSSSRKKWPYMDMLHELIGGTRSASSMDAVDTNDSVYDAAQNAHETASDFSGCDSDLERFSHHVEWSHKMTMTLLELYREHMMEFEDPGILKKLTWQTIADEMHRLGFSQVTGQLCEKKFRNMKCTYRTIVERKDNNPGKKTKWPYVGLIRELTAGRGRPDAEADDVSAGLTPSNFFSAAQQSDVSELDAIKLEAPCDEHFDEWSENMTTMLPQQFDGRSFHISETLNSSTLSHMQHGHHQQLENDFSHQLATASGVCDGTLRNHTSCYEVTTYGGDAGQPVENGWPYVRMVDGLVNAGCSDVSAAPIVIKIEDQSGTEDDEAENDDTVYRCGYFSGAASQTTPSAAGLPCSRDDSGSDTDVDDRMDWTQEMVSALLDKYKERKSEIDRLPRRKISVWKEIAADMVRDGYTQLNGSRCAKKFRNLKGAYQRIMESGGKCSETARKRWPYLQRLIVLMDPASKADTSTPVNTRTVRSASHSIANVTTGTVSYAPTTTTPTAAQGAPRPQSNSSFVSGVRLMNADNKTSSENRAVGPPVRRYRPILPAYSQVNKPAEVREPEVEHQPTSNNRQPPPDWFVEFMVERRKTDMATMQLLKSIRNDQRRQAAERDALLRELNANVRSLIGRL